LKDTTMVPLRENNKLKDWKTRQITWYKKSLKIPKVQSQALNGRIDNAMAPQKDKQWLFIYKLEFSQL
jgi:hypothetical protein